MRPLIGITTYSEPASWGAWGEVPAALLPLGYVRAVERVGGRPLLLPPGDGVEEALRVLDGLILSGGSDLDPATYGHEPHPETRNVRPERDRAELALLEAALGLDLPLLAICRGLELLNVGLGGDLDQHLPERLGHSGHRERPGTWSRHEVVVEPGSRLARILGEGVHVHSHHHQGPGRVAAGLAVTARAHDGSVEGLEHPDRTFAVGVLWHPEEGGDDRLFAALVAEARSFRARRPAIPHPE
ncbi:MAG: gamma-glutamyl-gamma-aminobutyrate hydrolase family protein [Thermoleophilia bacterium]